MARGVPQERDRLVTHVESDLAAWVRKEANHRGYTTSAFMRIVLVWLREELLHEPPAVGTLPGDANARKGDA